MSELAKILFGCSWGHALATILGFTPWRINMRNLQWNAERITSAFRLENFSRIILFLHTDVGTYIRIAHMNCVFSVSDKTSKTRTICWFPK
jgi:hypothetical protein